MDFRGRLRRLTRGVWIGLLGAFAVGLALVYAAGETLPVGSKATPFTLTVFSSLSPELQAQEASTAPFLFDRDTTTEHVVFADESQESRVQAAFESPQDVRAIKIFGAAPYFLTVQADTAGSYQTIAGLEKLNLTPLPTGWTTFTATTPVTTGKLQFVFTQAPGGTATGLRELEIWTTAAPVNVKNGAALLDKLLGPTPPAQARLYNAYNPTANSTVGVITPTDSGADLADNSFSFTLNHDPAHFVRAYLTYELFGQESFVSPLRKINGLMSNAGGALILPTASWSPQVERINPAWLKLGANTIEFSVLSASFKDAGYTVRNVRVIGELDTGANMIETLIANTPDEARTNPVEALYDGDLATGWRPYPEDQPYNVDIPIVEFSFRRPTQMEAISFNLSAKIEGQLQVSIKQAGLWTDFPAGAGALDGGGWYTISIPTVLEGVKLTFPVQGEFVSNAEIREFLFIGSGVGARTAPPKIFITYPDAGQFRGRQAFVQGFVEPWNNGSGDAKITLGGQTVLQFAGTISNTRTKDSVGLTAQADNDSWSLEVKAVYPNGETVSTIVPLTQQMSDAVPASGPVAGSVSGTVSNKGKKTLSNDESTLVFEAGSVATDTTVTIKPLLDTEVPALDVGMTNVTKGPRRGYRFTPHGAKFLKNVALTLPYDKALIPPGHTEDDVKTFYFDDQAGRWVELTRVSVDKTAKVINSQTNHFTDMINATITVPDHPNPTSFNPTSMKDIKAADPGAQINLIEAPKVNNMGDARLSYPIEVPPGRQGMQPQLSINYNSSGGNGWLGVGWELSTPSISIDTRFGVPKYDEAKREETYLFNGQQLVKMPNGEYRQRIEGAFNRIVRRGDSPANYWWVVTDKNGTRSIFGGDDTAQLRSQDRIFTWHLNRTVNANGNTVDYLYDRKELPGHNQGGGTPGESASYTYLKEIRYTGTGPAQQSDETARHVPLSSGNYYRVLFHHDPAQPKRLDAVVDGRPGFKTVLDERLKTIEVDLIEAGVAKRVRSYVLNYKTGDFDKTLLTTIVQHGSNGVEFNRHGFDYFAMPTMTDGYDAFSTVEGWSVPALKGGLNLTTNRDVHASAYLGFMLVVDPFHIGAGFGAGKGESKTELSTVDLNGDGLSDFLETGSTYYKNQWSHATQGGRSFNGNGIVGSVDSLGFEKNELRSRDVGIHVGTHSGAGANLTAGKSMTTVTGSKMLADIDGDGLVDQLSASGGPLMVQLNNGNGFNGQIPWAGGANITPPLTAAEKQQLLNDYPLSDPVRAWKAPFEGTVNISGTVAKPTAADSTQGEDGVRIEVFKGGSLAPLYEKTFVGVETLDLSTVAQLQNLGVVAGESVYFKLNSVEDSDKDLLHTNFNVAYSNVVLTSSTGTKTPFAQLGDAHYAQTTAGDPQFSSSSETGFAMATVVPCVLIPSPADPTVAVCSPGIVEDAAFKMPYKGTIRLTNVLTKQAVAEDLLFRVTRLDEINGQVTATTLLSKTVAAGDISGFNEVLDGLLVTTSTQLVFDISAPKLGTVLADRVQWTPEVRYTNVCTRNRTGENVDDPSTIQPGETDTPNDFLNGEVCTALSASDQELTDRDLPGAFDPQDGSGPTKLYIFKPTALLSVYPFKRQSPMHAWIAPRDGVVRLVASAFKNAATSSDIHLKVQSTNRLIAQHSFAAAAISPSAQIMSLDLPVTAGQRLFFNVHSATAIPATFTDTNGTEQPVFDWTPELLYVDSPHCYTDATTGLQTCVPVTTSYTSAAAWTMHFDSLCLAPDRCVPVDCTGPRTPGAPAERAASQCVTTEPNPNPPPPTINVPLTAAERTAFNLNRIQYVVPVVNRDHLDWTPYNTNPFQGYYRDWAYLAWNGNFAWEPARLVSPPSVPGSATQEASDNVQPPHFWQPRPLASGDRYHPGTPLWVGAGNNQFMSATLGQPSRVGGNVTPFVSAGQGAGISLLRRTRNEQTRASLGFGSFGGSLNFGPAKTNVDLIDLNGDRYPDQVADNAVVFNRGTPAGGFEGAATGVNFSINNESSVRKTESRTAAMTASIFQTETGAGHEEAQYSSSGKVKGQKSQGISVGTGYGSAKTTVDFIDINGDGLPDRVYRDGGSVLVRLNLGGDLFGAEENWAAPAWSVSNISRLGQLGPVSPNAVRINDTVNASASFFAASGSRTIVDLTDMNGDGLPDLVMKEHGKDHFLVRVNRGSGFDPNEKKWYVPGWGTQIGRGATAALFGGNDVIGYNETLTASKGFGHAFHFHIQLWLITLHLYVEPEVGGSIGQSAASLALQDLDGDGFADQVYRSAALLPGGAGATEVKVKRSKIGKTNLLRTVSRPLGGGFEIDYAREGNFVDRGNSANVIEMNSSKWVMSQVMVHDGQGNAYPTHYKHFTSGFYHRLERENFGFSHCQEIRADGATTDTFYHNQDYTKKGLLFRTIRRDKQGRLFTREDNNYDVFTIQLAQGTRPAVRFPAPSHKESHFYEGTATLLGDIAVTTTPAPGVKRRAESYTYETEFGNVVALTDFGDLDSASDDVQASIGYFKDLSAYILKPNSIIASSGASLLRQRDANYAPGTGNLTQVRQAIGNGQTAVTDLAYFSNGNLQTVIGPADQPNQRYTLNYEYDPALDTHVKRVSDSFLLSSQATYNLLFGKIATSLDTNGNTTSTKYDDFGRLSSIIGPYEQTTGNITLRFDYHPEGSPGCAAPGAVGCAGTVPFALTQHLDLDALGNTKAASGTIDTILFTDGLKRVLQTKKDATVLEGSAPLDRMIVSGRVVFDEVGRTIKQSYPTVEPLGLGATFNTAFDTSAPPTVTKYDEIDRVKETILPDTTTTTMHYGFGADRKGDNQFETLVTDANGKQKRTYRDARDLITTVKESNNLQTIWTSYTYDPLKQITQVLDDKNNTTTIAYDNLGRRTLIDNPDTGKTETQYDTASNVTKKITANLRAQAKSIDYAYDFNRLSTITYLNFPGNNISYTYGAPGAPNNTAGRITKIVSHTTVTSQGNLQDTEERQYGRLGETVYEKKTVVTATDPLHPSVFETRFAFDTFGRLLRLTYPDGEILTNTYDSGGNLLATQGAKNGYHYNYLKQLSYDKFEQRVLLEAGNNVKTAYTYNANTRRLNTLTAGKGNGNLFQNLAYSYDKVGNILGLKNTVEVPPANSYGGPTNQTFAYDELYRLTHAEGTFQYSPGKTHTYSLDMAYDSIHNIVTKHQLHTIVQPSAVAITQKKTSYDFNYQYNASGLNSIRPHAPIHIGDRAYTYDANGNQTGWTADTNGTNRTIIWNEENRIESISDQGHTKTYKYDDQGNRTIKRGPQGETVYVNQFYTQRPGATGTKHVYAGTSRIVSKLVKQDTPGANPQGNTPFEKDLYFYHPDHLGSSNYITDTNGKLYEHLEYFPFGESWVEENSNTQRTPYLFTAKELDEETGLYYYGARYYDPRTSVWQSGDPILGKYLPNVPTKPEEVVKLLPPTVQNPLARFDLPGIGGVYNSININLFAYASNNPLIFVDPTGSFNILVGGGVTAAAPTGAEVSAGIVVNPGLFGQKADAGGFVAVGATVGVNISADVFVGFVKGEIENVSGQTVNQNIGIGRLSISIFHDPKTGEVIGGTAGWGPGATPVGYSGAYETTGTLTIRDVAKWISGLFSSKPEPPKLEPRLNE